MPADERRPPPHAMRKIYRSMRNRLLSGWRGFWLGRAGARGFGRFAARIASRKTAPHHQRAFLADLTPRGFIDPDAIITHPDLRLGTSVFIGGNVMISASPHGGAVELKDRVQLYGNTFIDTGAGGCLHIGAGTHIQPGCHIHAHLSDICIGSEVEIAAGCALYSYDHGIESGTPIMRQALTSKGPILIGDGAWLGHGVTVLQGVTIGAGAVIAAGAVVTRDVPENAIAAGVPARVIGFRDTADAVPAAENITPISSSLPSSGNTRRKELTHTP